MQDEHDGHHPYTRRASAQAARTNSGSSSAVPGSGGRQQVVPTAPLQETGNRPPIVVAVDQPEKRRHPSGGASNVQGRPSGEKHHQLVSKSSSESQQRPVNQVTFRNNLGLNSSEA